MECDGLEQEGSCCFAVHSCGTSRIVFGTSCALGDRCSSSVVNVLQCVCVCRRPVVLRAASVAVGRVLGVCSSSIVSGLC
jgi:hypothetical protein